MVDLDQVWVGMHMDLCKLLDGEYLHETIKMQVSRCVVQLLHLQQA